MTLNDLELLLDYHYWARDRMMAALGPLTAEEYSRDLGNSFKSIRETAVHIYAAEVAWCLRWHGTSPTALLSGDGFPDLATLEAAWAEHEQKMRSFLTAAGEDGIGRQMDYRSLAGVAGRNSVRFMLPHVVNHASYHRGQITTMLRQIGAATPKSMDLIAFYRERGVDA
jgi:uncharacterized damage-inducible protein DinB